MKYLVMMGCFFICSKAYTQKIPKWSLDFSFGSSLMTGKPEEVDQIYGLATQVGFTYRFKLTHNKSVIATGLQFDAGIYFTDGYFTTINNKKVFSRTPDNYKLNRIGIQSINLPLKYEFWKEGTIIGIGPVLSYQLGGYHQYKIGTANYNVRKLAIDNRFRWGVGANILLQNKLAEKKYINLSGMGIYYQVSSFVNEGKAFKPLILSFKWSVGK